MRKVFLVFALVGLLGFLGVAQPQLSWQFANFEVVNAGAELHFDVQVKADVATSYHRDLQVYFDYNTAGFSSGIVSGGGITVSPGPLMDNHYSVVNTVDNTVSKVAIITEGDNEFTAVGSATDFNLMPATYTTLFHIAMDISDNTALAGISFDQALMNGGQYYQNTAAIEPVKYADPSLYGADLNDKLSTAYGMITYANLANTPIQNCTISISGLGSTVSDASGYYNFTGISDGTFALTTTCAEPYTYVTDVGDMNVVIDHILGNSLTGIYFLAGDVTGNSVVDVSDLNLMSDNVLGTATGYPVADWLFESQNVTVTNGVGSVNYHGLMAGDADGSN